MKNILVSIIMLSSFSTQAQSNSEAIHVEVLGKGNGKPVMLIPGFTVPGEIWYATVAQLEKNHECHVVTLAGFGGQSPVEFPWLSKVNESLRKYIQQRGLRGLTIIGHSLGGTIATWLSSRTADQIARIILVDALPAAGAIMIPDFNPENLAYDSPFNNQQLAMSEKDFETMATAMSRAMSTNTQAQQMIKDWIIQADRKTYVYGYTDYLKLDLREELKQVTVPVTIIAAEKPFGKDMVKQTYASQYTNLSHYDLIIADGAAHFVMFDKPDWFVGQVQQILAAN